MKKLYVIAFLAVVMVIFSACTSNQPSIVGEWYSEADNATMAINENGTFSLRDNTSEEHDLLVGTYRIEGNKFLFTPQGEMELANTYELKGDKLTLTYETYSTEFKRVKK